MEISCLDPSFLTMLMSGTCNFEASIFFYMFIYSKVRIQFLFQESNLIGNFLAYMIIHIFGIFFFNFHLGIAMVV